MKSVKPGALLRVEAGEGCVGFVRVLQNNQIALYSRGGAGVFDDLGEVFDSDVVWKLTVDRSVFRRPGWNLVGFRPLEQELTKPVYYFMQDQYTGDCSIYRSSDGDIRDARPEECEGLECAAVWEPHHVEDRIRDHFAGRKNVWVEQLNKIR